MSPHHSIFARLTCHPRMRRALLPTPSWPQAKALRRALRLRLGVGGVAAVPLLPPEELLVRAVEHGEQGRGDPPCPRLEKAARAHLGPKPAPVWVTHLESISPRGGLWSPTPFATGMGWVWSPSPHSSPAITSHCPVGGGGGRHRGAPTLRHCAAVGKGKLRSSPATAREGPRLGHCSAAGKGKVWTSLTTVKGGGGAEISPLLSPLPSPALASLHSTPGRTRSMGAARCPASTSRQPCSAGSSGGQGGEVLYRGRQGDARPAQPREGGGGITHWATTCRGMRPPAPDNGSPPDDWNYGELWGIMGNYGELWGIMGELWVNYG